MTTSNNSEYLNRLRDYNASLMQKNHSRINLNTFLIGICMALYAINSNYSILFPIIPFAISLMSFFKYENLFSEILKKSAGLQKAADIKYPEGIALMEKESNILIRRVEIYRKAGNDLLIIGILFMTFLFFLI